MTQITEAKILILATNGFEQSELEKPLKDLRDKGAMRGVISTEDSDVSTLRDKANAHPEMSGLDLASGPCGIRLR